MKLTSLIMSMVALGQSAMGSAASMLKMGAALTPYKGSPARKNRTPGHAVKGRGGRFMMFGQRCRLVKRDWDGKVITYN